MLRHTIKAWSKQRKDHQKERRQPETRCLDMNRWRKASTPCNLRLISAVGVGIYRSDGVAVLIESHQRHGEA